MHINLLSEQNIGDQIVPNAAETPNKLPVMMFSLEVN